MLANGESFKNNRERTDRERRLPVPGSWLCGEWVGGGGLKESG